jgi:hypothetical protein
MLREDEIADVLFSFETGESFEQRSEENYK